MVESDPLIQVHIISRSLIEFPSAASWGECWWTARDVAYPFHDVDRYEAERLREMFPGLIEAFEHDIDDAFINGTHAKY